MCGVNWESIGRASDIIDNFQYYICDLDTIIGHMIHHYRIIIYDNPTRYI